MKAWKKVMRGRRDSPSASRKGEAQRRRIDEVERWDNALPFAATSINLSASAVLISPRAKFGSGPRRNCEPILRPAQFDHAREPRVRGHGVRARSVIACFGWRDHQSGYTTRKSLAKSMR